MIETIIDLAEQEGCIDLNKAKSLFETMLYKNENPRTLIRDMDLFVPTDEDLLKYTTEIFQEYPILYTRYKNGEEWILYFFLGSIAFDNFIKNKIDIRNLKEILKTTVLL